MWLSINTLFVDQDRVLVSTGEIQSHVKFGKKMTLIYSFIIFSSTPVLEYYYFFKYFSFPCVFLSIHGFKFTGFLILVISNPGDSCKLLQRQKIQARENRTMARTNAVKNHGVKPKDKVYMSWQSSYYLYTNFPVDCSTEFPLITALLEISVPLIRSIFIQINFYMHLSSNKRSW